jgi:hypothetical protein
MTGHGTNSADRLRKAIEEEAERSGVTPRQLAKELTTSPKQKTISIRPSLTLRTRLDQEAKDQETTVGRVCKVVLEHWATRPE